MSNELMGLKVTSQELDALEDVLDWAFARLESADFVPPPRAPSRAEVVVDFKRRCLELRDARRFALERPASLRPTAEGS